MSKIADALRAFAGQLTADRNRIGVLYHERLCVAASHTLLSILRKSSSVPIANFLPVLPNLVTVYHLLPPKTSAYCPYSLRKRQHSHQLRHIEFSQYKNSFINRCLFKFRWLIRLFIFVVFSSLHVVLIIIGLLCFLTFYFYFFLIHCNSVRMSYCIKRLLDLT